MAESAYISYELFGRHFFELAVSDARIAGAFTELAGSSFDFGPIGAGPAKLAKVSANVAIGDPSLTRDVGDLIRFRLNIPLRLHLLIDLALDKQHFDVDGHIALRLTARAAEPLKVVIDVDEPRRRDVHIDVRPASLRGAVLRVLGSVDTEIKRFVAQYVAEEIHKPHVVRARVIDVADRIEQAWSIEPAPADDAATASAAVAD
ncbi:MAG TPA: hypothetical protein VIW24_06895 [Aldersonia sp.]